MADLQKKISVELENAEKILAELQKAGNTAGDHGGQTGTFLRQNWRVPMRLLQVRVLRGML